MYSRKMKKSWHLEISVSLPLVKIKNFSKKLIYIPTKKFQIKISDLESKSRKSGKIINLLCYLILEIFYAFMVF